MSKIITRRGALRAVAGASAASRAAAAEGADPTDDRRAAEIQAHCDWLAGIIRQTEGITAGMTREEVEQTLEIDFAPRPTSARYQHMACSYIKLDVSFEPDEARPGDRSRDKVTGRGMPILDRIPNRNRF